MLMALYSMHVYLYTYLIAVRGENKYSLCIACIGIVYIQCTLPCRCIYIIRLVLMYNILVECMLCVHMICKMHLAIIIMYLHVL